MKDHDLGIAGKYYPTSREKEINLKDIENTSKRDFHKELEHICPYNEAVCQNNQDCEHCSIQENEGYNTDVWDIEKNNNFIFDRVIELVKNIQSLEEELQGSKILIKNLKKEMKDLMTKYGGEV